jgi:hypothetical protein
MNTNHSPEALLQMLYHAQMEKFRADCERIFGPMADFVKDEESKVDLVFAA